MVARATNAGVGVFSEQVEGRTLGAIPMATVEGVTLSPSCLPSLLVRWTLSDPWLVYAEPEDVVYVSYTISNLTRNTTYTVSVAVRNESGTGNFTDISSDETFLSHSAAAVCDPHCQSP